MEEDQQKNLSDGIKAAIVSNATQWALTNYQTTEKLRRNLLISSIIGIFIGMTGAKPVNVAALGLELGNVSGYTFYTLSCLVTIYLYWSYLTRCRTGDIYRNNIGKIYYNVIGYNYFAEIVASRSKADVVSYYCYRNIMPLIATLLSLIAIGCRVYLERQS